MKQNKVKLHLKESSDFFSFLICYHIHNHIISTICLLTLIVACDEYGMFGFNSEKWEK